MWQIPRRLGFWWAGQRKIFSLVRIFITVAPLPKAARISASSSALVGLLLAQWDSTGWLCLCNLRGGRCIIFWSPTNRF